MNNLFIVCHIGGCKITLMLVEVKNYYSLKVLKYFSKEHNGMQKGIIINFNEITSKLKSLISIFQKETGVNIENITVNIAGEHLQHKKIINSVKVNHKVTENDIISVQNINLQSLNHNQVILDYSISKYILDDTFESENPLNLIGKILKAEANVIIASRHIIKNIENIFNYFNIKIDFIVSNHVACAKATLQDNELELGVCLIDIGKDTTNISIFHNNQLMYLETFSFGGFQITSDIAILLNTDLKEAEKIKLNFQRFMKKEIFKIKNIRTGEDQIFETSFLEEIVKARIYESCQIIKEHVKSKKELMKTGIVVTGGSSNLPIFFQAFKAIFNINARLGVAFLVKENPILYKPQWTVLIGLALYSFDKRYKREKQNIKIKKQNLIDKILNWVKNNL